MYIHIGSICCLTPTVVMVARTMAKMMVTTTSENMAERANFCRFVILTLLRVRNGIETTFCVRKLQVLVNQETRGSLLKQSVKTSNTLFTHMLTKLRPCVAHSRLAVTLKDTRVQR